MLFSPYPHELDERGSACSADCPACRWADEDSARLRELCEQASAEQDGERLVELISEILLLLPEDPHEAVVLVRNKSTYISVEKQPAKHPAILPDAT